MTRYGLGKIRSCEQRVCSAGVSKCKDGLLARLRGAARPEIELLYDRLEREKKTNVVCGLGDLFRKLPRRFSGLNLSRNFYDLPILL